MRLSIEVINNGVISWMKIENIKGIPFYHSWLEDILCVSSFLSEEMMVQLVIDGSSM